MAGRVKRTYNLSPATVHRVRELAERANVAATQDAVVELAVERLYADVRERDEAAEWEAAAADPAFASEVRGIAADFHDAESWPG
jgi:hypothetical protein